MALTHRIVRSLSTRPRNFLIFVSAAIFLTAGCARRVEPSPAITIEHDILPKPLRIGPSTVVLRLTDAAMKPVTGAHINLEADMSHAGMAPVFGEAQEVAVGEYQGHIEFSMAGDWVVLIHVRLSSGQQLDRQIDVRGVKSN